MRVAIVGPESTGKTILCKKLALYYEGLWVPEYARYYLMTKNNSYSYHDLECIAMGQLFWEDLYTYHAKNRFVFFDTTLLTVKIWSEWKYGRTSRRIEKNYKSRKYDLILLSDVDLPWVYDPQRENPHDRHKLFDYHIELLKNSNVKFETVKGLNKNRIENAIKIIENTKKL